MVAAADHAVPEILLTQPFIEGENFL